MGRQRGGAKKRKRSLGHAPDGSQSVGAGSQSASNNLAGSHPVPSPKQTRSESNANKVESPPSSTEKPLRPVVVKSDEMEEMETNARVSEVAHKKSKYAPVLTAEEADHLRETSNLFRSNLLKLEIEQLLEEVQLRYDSSKMVRLGKLVSTLGNEMEQLQSSEHALNKEFKGMWNWPVKPLAKASFTFHKPEAVHIVGSFASETLAKPVKQVDVAIELPADSFEPRDYLNYRYHDKRLAYLVVLGKALAKRKSWFKDVCFQAFRCDANKPVLVLTPADSQRLNGFTIRVLPYISDKLFPLKKLKPLSSNVRFASTDVGLKPTPMYNMNILEETASNTLTFQELIEDACDRAKCFASLVILLKIWCRQRGICNRASPDALNDFLLTVLSVHLLNERVLNENMSTQQMFRGVLTYLGSSDLSNKVVRMKAYEDIEAATIPNDVFLRFFPVNFIAPCGRFNLAWRVTLSGYNAVRTYARTSLRLLEATDGTRVGGRSSFESIFTTRFQPLQRYDRYLRVRIPKAAGPLGAMPYLCDEVDHCRSAWRVLESLFCKGFIETGRATELRLLTDSSDCAVWPLHEAPKREKTIVVGLALDLAKAFRVIDKGPKADEAEKAAAFRSVWKSRSELRRFKDGSILEAVVWKDEEMDESGDFTQSIASYLLSQHEPFCKLRHPVKVIGDKLDTVLRVLGADEKRSQHSVDSTARLHESFSILQKHLRSLSLPLKLVEVIAVDPAMRYSNAQVPTQHPFCFGKADSRRDAVVNAVDARYVAKHARAIDVLLRFETSGRWPDSVDGIERMKSAFYVNIAESLERDFKGEQRCVVYEDHVDVLYNGYPFRVEIKHDRVIGLLDGSIQPNVLAQRASEAVANKQSKLRKTKPPTVLAQDLHRKTVRLPVLHSQIQALHTSIGDNGGARVMSPVVRLAKLWVAGHRLWDHLPQEVTELLVASLFVNPDPYNTPKSTLTGFLHFLDRLGNWDWDNAPMVIDLGQSLTPEDFNVIRQEFFKAKERNNVAPMSIITDADRANGWTSYWTTRDTPSKSVLKRITFLAKACHKLVSAMCRDGVSDEDRWFAMFQSDVLQSNHDIVILLNDVGDMPEMVAASRSRKKSKNSAVKIAAYYKNLAASSETEMMLGDPPIVQLVRDIQATFGHLFDVYFNPFHGKEIGLTWKPDAQGPHRLKVARSGYTHPVAGYESGEEERFEVTVNAAEVADELSLIGKGYIREIKVLQGT